MILYAEAINETKAKVVSINHREDLIPAEQLNVGEYQVETLPLAEALPKKSSIMYINPETNEITFEYADRPATTDEELSDVKSEITDMKDTLAQILALLQT